MHIMPEVKILIAMVINAPAPAPSVHRHQQTQPKHQRLNSLLPPSIFTYVFGILQRVDRMATPPTRFMTR